MIENDISVEGGGGMFIRLSAKEGVMLCQFLTKESKIVKNKLANLSYTFKTCQAQLSSAQFNQIYSSSFHFSFLLSDTRSRYI